MLRHWFQCPVDPFKNQSTTELLNRCLVFFLFRPRKPLKRWRTLRFVRCFCCESSNLRWGLVEARWSDTQDFWSFFLPSIFVYSLLWLHIRSFAPPPKKKKNMLFVGEVPGSLPVRPNTNPQGFQWLKGDRKGTQWNTVYRPDLRSLSIVWIIFGWYLVLHGIFMCFLKMLNFKIGHAIA